MDKVRAFLNVMWVQRFWVLSVVGVIAAMVCWTMASGQLAAEFTANKTAITSQFSDMSSISSKQVHGNDAVNARERQEASKIAENVRKLWQRLYDHQRKQVLYWPKALGAEFLTYIESRKFDSNIRSDMREKYLNYIKTQFDALVEIVKARKMIDGSSSGLGMGAPRMESAGRMGMGAPMVGEAGFVEEDYLVEWLDQDVLRQKLTFGRQPTSRQIWVAQEDLWVYETLLNVIKNTNAEKGAKRPDNTAIRVIQSLEVGQAAALAAAEPGNILLPESAAGGDPAASMEMPGGDPRSMGMDGMSGEGTSIDDTLLANRYIDAEGKPIADATTGLAVEHRRLPIRMVLMMDQQWLPVVLVQCANAPLPIEVQRVRINAEKSGVDKTGQAFEAMGGGAGTGMEGMGGRSPSGMGMGMGMGRMGMGRSMGMESRSMGMSMPMSSLSSTPGLSSLATVEIQGLVYIYNPPDDATLSVPGAEQETPAAELAAIQ